MLAHALNHILKCVVDFILLYFNRMLDFPLCEIRVQISFFNPPLVPDILGHK